MAFRKGGYENHRSKWRRALAQPICKIFAARFAFAYDKHLKRPRFKLVPTQAAEMGISAAPVIFR